MRRERDIIDPNILKLYETGQKLEANDQRLANEQFQLPQEMLQLYLGMQNAETNRSIQEQNAQQNAFRQWMQMQEAPYDMAYRTAAARNYMANAAQQDFANSVQARQYLGMGGSPQMLESIQNMGIDPLMSNIPEEQFAQMLQSAAMGGYKALKPEYWAQLNNAPGAYMQRLEQAVGKPYQP